MLRGSRVHGQRRVESKRWAPLAHLRTKRWAAWEQPWALHRRKRRGHGQDPKKRAHTTRIACQFPWRHHNTARSHALALLSRVSRCQIDRRIRLPTTQPSDRPGKLAFQQASKCRERLADASRHRPRAAFSGSFGDTPWPMNPRIRSSDCLHGRGSSEARAPAVPAAPHKARGPARGS